MRPTVGLLALNINEHREHSYMPEPTTYIFQRQDPTRLQFHFAHLETVPLHQKSIIVIYNKIVSNELWIR